MILNLTLAEIAAAEIQAEDLAEAAMAIKTRIKTETPNLTPEILIIPIKRENMKTLKIDMVKHLIKF